MNIPSISLSTLQQSASSAYRKEVDALGKACINYGFVYLVDLFQPTILNKMLKANAAFFSMPIEKKMALATQRFQATNINRYRGYFPLSERSHTYKEGYEVGWQDYKLTGSGFVFDELSILPSPEPISGWTTLMQRYFTYQLNIGNILLKAFETYFELPTGYFTSKFRNTLSTLRILHYPPLNVEQMKASTELERDASDIFSTPAHTDSGIITLLLQDDTGGLEVLRSDGCWVAVHPMKYSLVMNLGDLLERWTGREFKATPHRVKASIKSRYSVPFFFEPEGSALIEPFQKSDDCKLVTYEAYLAEKIATFVEYQSKRIL